MAEIPVEKRRGVPWWAWLAGVVALAGVALVAFVWRRTAMTPAQEQDTMGGPDVPPPSTMTIPTAIALDGGVGLVGHTEVPVATPRTDGAVTQMATSDAGPLLSDVDLFEATPDKRSLLNRRVEFSNVRVLRVVNDRVFAVTSGRGGELYAMLDHGLDRGPMEHRVSVAVGQLLDVQGTFREPPDAEAARQQGLSVPLSAELITAFARWPVYLHVTLVRGAAVRTEARDP